MNYSQIIQESFQTFWKNKSLWVFGILAALVGQSEYSFSVNYRESYPVESAPALPEPYGSFFAEFFKNPIPYILAFAGISIALWILFGFVGWLAKGALIGMVNEIDQTGTTSVRSGWQSGITHAVPLFLISFILDLPQFIILVATLVLSIPIWLPLFQMMAGSFSGKTPDPEQMNEAFRSMGPNFFGGFLLICGLVCVLAILSWATNLWNTLAARSCVIENRGVFASLRRGWKITTQNIGYIFLTWLILVVLAAVYGFVAALPALALWIPTAQATLHNTWSATTIVLAVLTAIYLLVTLVLLGGILTTFNSTLWTKLYKGFLSKETALSVSTD